MTKPNYTITNDTITVVHEGEAHTVKEGAPNFAKLRQALIAKDWSAVPGFLTVEEAVKSWSEGEFSFSGDGTVTHATRPLPEALAKRMLAMIHRDEDPKPLCRFFERLDKNPSMRSVEQLFQFLQHCGIPLTEDGCFLAYKGVKNDLKDAHSGKWDNSPGAINKMPRNRISDDPRHACHAGFHVGALRYAQGFSQRVVVCKVDPEHVVSVPYDCSERKMRVCEYAVVGHFGGELPYTTIPAQDIPVVKTTVTTTAQDDGATPGKPKKSKVKKGGGKRGTLKPGEKELWVKLDDMDSEALLDAPLKALRRYATLKCRIVGAGRFSKVAVVAAIMKVRHPGG